MTRSIPRHGAWIAALLLCIGMLGFWGTVAAQNQAKSGAGQPPFASAVDQREEMIRELREIRSLMKEQNALLKQLVEQGNANAKAKR